jgi:hypothetical protein
VKAFLAAAAVAGATAWLSLSAAGTPSLACAWVSGAAAAASGIAAASWGRLAHPSGTAHLQVMQIMAGAAADRASGLGVRIRFWAAHRLMDDADRHTARNGATSVSIRPGRLARPVMPREVLDILPDPAAPGPITSSIPTVNDD